MQLNIKDPETVRLARELAGATGRTVTETIRTALEREVARRDSDYRRLMTRINSDLADIETRLPADLHGLSSREVMDAIYDEDGLPR